MEGEGNMTSNPGDKTTVKHLAISPHTLLVPGIASIVGAGTTG